LDKLKELMPEAIEIYKLKMAFYKVILKFMGVQE
jgi:hypothetical protein